MLQVYSILFILFHTRTIFKVSALEQPAIKWPVRVGGRLTAPTPPWQWACQKLICKEPSCTNLLKPATWFLVISKRKHTMVFRFSVTKAIRRYFIVVIERCQRLSEDWYHLLIRVDDLGANKSVKTVLIETLASFPLVARSEVHSNN